jgi:hypothetical protein
MSREPSLSKPGSTHDLALVSTALHMTGPSSHGCQMRLTRNLSGIRFAATDAAFLVSHTRSNGPRSGTLSSKEVVIVTGQERYGPRIRLRRACIPAPARNGLLIAATFCEHHVVASADMPARVDTSEPLLSVQSQGVGLGQALDASLLSQLDLRLSTHAAAFDGPVRFEKGQADRSAVSACQADGRAAPVASRGGDTASSWNS